MSNEPIIRFPTAAELPAAHRHAPITQREWLCGGTLRTWEGAMQEVLSPVCVRQADGSLTRLPLGQTPLLGEAEALAALEAAVRAYDLGRGAWPTMTVGARIEAVERFSAAMQARRDEIVQLLMWEIGKSLADSRKEFDRTIQYIRDTVEALKDLDRRSGRFEVDEGIIGQIRRAPLGVVLCLGPFNYPLNETFTTLLPALVMGNTVVFKPPKLGVLLFRPLLEAFRDAFPPGVVNTIYGEGRTTIGPLMRSGKVDVLAFIGTSRVSHQLKSQHPALNRLRCVLGLDAKNPAIVLEDADLELALQECLGGSLAFNGQRCTALKILFVHDRLYDRFVEGLAAKADALRRGMPWEEGVFATPLPEQRKPESMQAFVDDALAHGGRIANALGGRSLGTFYAPTVIADVTSQMRLWREEQFGPVVPVVRFRDVEEPLAYVRDSTFGQQVSVFGNDPAALGALVDPLVNQVSRVNLNSQCQRGPDSFPFTGRKDSAEGTLSVGDALRVFSIRALVAAKATERNKAIVSQIVRERSSNFLSTDFIF